MDLLSLARSPWPWATSLSADLSEQASKFLLDLAHGKYDAVIALIDKTLARICIAFSWVITARRVLDMLVAINKATAPSSVVSDGRGGWVLATNSRIGPDGNFL
jgi:hypothetical protein